MALGLVQRRFDGASSECVISSKKAITRFVSHSQSPSPSKETTSNDRQYSRYNKPFILPNLATGAEVILPMSQLRWLLDQPDHILSQAEVNREFLHADWTMLHPNIVRDSVHGPVIRREMTKGLDSYADEVVDEIRDSLKTFWGDKRQWHEVAVYDTMLNVISRISNRALVGLPLCRDEEYIRSSSTFARFVVITASLLNLLPSVLRPVLGPLITAYDMYHYRRMTEHIFPVIKARMAAFQPGHDYKKPDYSIHNDYIHWALHHAFCQDDPAERTPEMITKRLAVLTFGAVHSSVITITNAIFDIASSPASIAIQQGLREEVEHVTNNNNHSHGPTVIGTTTTTTMWKGLNLAKMIRLDSALRESMRLWGFLSRGVMKMVMVPDGMMIPSGEHLPFGAKVGVTAYAVHHDESIYPNALCFDPFRFSRPVESASAVSSVLGVDEVPIRRPLPMVKSTDSFMGFSHGRSIWYDIPFFLSSPSSPSPSAFSFLFANPVFLIE